METAGEYFAGLDLERNGLGFRCRLYGVGKCGVVVDKGFDKKPWEDI